MGLNSLMAIELRNRLETALGRPLSATLAWNYPTIEAIVGVSRRRRRAGAPGDDVRRSRHPAANCRNAGEMALDDRRRRHAGVARATRGRRAMNDTPDPARRRVRAQACPDGEAGACAGGSGAAGRSDRDRRHGLSSARRRGHARPFWQLMRDGACAVGDVPPDRWNGDSLVRSRSVERRQDGYEIGLLPRPHRWVRRRLFWHSAARGGADGSAAAPVSRGRHRSAR